jgi:uncharacterized membrane protein SpoIIM required for sporulation
MTQSLALDRVAEAPSPGAEPSLKSSEFRRGREASWRDLEGLVGRVEKRGVTSLLPDELQRIPLLYRATLSSLSVARSIALDRNLLLYLENLSLRAFLVVYGPRTSLREGFSEFLRRGFPEAVRTARWHFLLSMIALAAGTVAGFMLTVGDESWFSALSGVMGGGRGPSSTRQYLLDHEIFAPWPGAAESFGLFASFLFSHNTVVGVLTFALGLGAGVPTLLLLIYQGLILGAFVALHYNRDLTIDFIGWLSIHGVTELSAIALCGAGGFVIADTMLFPGRYSRLESLALRGRTAAQIAVGAAAMFFVAAILEGGFRQLVASTPLRFTVSGVTLIAWLAYFLYPREARP